MPPYYGTLSQALSYSLLSIAIHQGTASSYVVIDLCTRSRHEKNGCLYTYRFDFGMDWEELDELDDCTCESESVSIISDVEVLYTRKGSDRGNPQSTIMYCIKNIPTHSNGTTSPV